MQKITQIVNTGAYGEEASVDGKETDTDAEDGEKTSTECFLMKQIIKTTQLIKMIQTNEYNADDGEEV